LSKKKPFDEFCAELAKAWQAPQSHPRLKTTASPAQNPKKGFAGKSWKDFKRVG